MEENPYKAPLSSSPPVAGDWFPLTKIKFRSPLAAFFAAVPPATAMVVIVARFFTGQWPATVAAISGIWVGLFAAALTGLSRWQASRTILPALRVLFGIALVAAAVVFIAGPLFGTTFLAFSSLLGMAAPAIAGILCIAVEAGSTLRRSQRGSGAPV